MLVQSSDVVELDLGNQISFWLRKMNQQEGILSMHIYKNFNSAYNNCSHASAHMKKIKKFAEITQYGTNDLLLQAFVKPIDIKTIPLNFRKDLQLLLRTAAHFQLVSLSANQIQMNHRMFVMLKQHIIAPGKWGDYENVKPSDYEAIVNPELVDQTKLKFKDFQQCPSIPGMRFHVWNPILQTYKYYKPILNEKQVRFQQSKLTLKGFKARLWDHQVRHLNGILAFADQISHCQIAVNSDYEDNPGTHELVELMKTQIKFMRKQNLMEYFRTGKSQAAIKQSIPQEIPEQITKEMKSKMGRQYKRVQQMLQREMKKGKLEE